MSVYVDNLQLSFGRMKMSHMIADSSDELIAMADVIGVARRWIQHPGDPVQEHFDVSQTKRAIAVEHGAIEITWQELGRMMLQRARERRARLTGQVE